MRRRTLIIMYRDEEIIQTFQEYFGGNNEVLSTCTPKYEVLKGREGIPMEDVVYVIGMEFGISNPHGNDVADFLLGKEVPAKNIIRISQVDDRHSRAINAIWLQVMVPDATWENVAQEIARRFPENVA